MVGVRPLTEGLGVEVTGRVGSDFTLRGAADECEELLARHGVVVYRGANVSDDELVEFSSLLGEIAIVPTGEHERPEIQTITSDPAKTSATLVSIRKGNLFWHVDGMTQAIPQRTTLLSAREVADLGEGGTEFVSTYLGYASLSDDDRALIADLSVVHSFAAAQLRAHPDADAETRAMWERVPAREHPLVWQRRDGRTSLLIGATAERVVGWPADESRALLDRLLDTATRPHAIVHHDWAKGDLVVWDNTGLLHRAMPFEPTSPRLFHRTTLVGVEPTS